MIGGPEEPACRPRRPHQPCDTVTPARSALMLERGVDARGTIGSPRPAVDDGDLLGQLGVADRTGTGCCGEAGIVGGSGDLQ